MRYAIAMNQHNLTFGAPGTAKTALADAIFNGISGAEIFRTELTAYMTDDAIFGPINGKRYRDEGILENVVAGMLPEANFARLGEFLDANPMLLRTLLGVLHERRVRRGRQILQIPLMSAYCDTNINPTDYLHQNPQAEAIIDRILFLDRFDHLETESDVSEMVYRHQAGIIANPKAELRLEDVQLIAQCIIEPPGLIKDRKLLDTYAAAAHEYRNERTKMSEEDKLQFILPRISDRRIALASQMLEVTALLDHRFEADARDVASAGIVLCTSEPERALWSSIVEKHTTKYSEERKAAISSIQMRELLAIEGEMQRDVFDNADIKAAVETLRLLGERLTNVTPDDGVTTDKKHRLTELYEKAKQEVENRTVAALNLSAKP